MQTLSHLTGLRGAAALLVFVSHSANQGLMPSLLGNGLGQLGVMIFFILSGFLMGYLYLPKTFTIANAKTYLIARITRILPLYLSLLILSFVISNWVYSDFHYDFRDTTQLIKATILLSAPYEFWTIPVEFQFYIIFIALWALKGRVNIYIPMALVTVLGLGISIAYFIKKGFPLFFITTYLLPFIIGLITALNFDKLTKSHIAKNSVLPIVFLVVLLTINLPSLRLQLGWVLDEQLFLRTWGDPINLIVAYGIFFFAAVNAKSYGFMSQRLSSYYGEISFGFYLMHYPILKLVKLLPVPGFIGFLIALAITTVLSHLSFRYFETPVAKTFKPKKAS